MSEDQGNTTPENQDDGKEKLFFGQYKTLEEAEGAFKKQQKENLELKETLDREERLNSLLSVEPRSEGHTPADDGDGDTQATNPFTGTFDDEEANFLNGYIRANNREVLKQAADMINTGINNAQANLVRETRFFKKYPKLEMFREEVQHQANLLAKQLSGRKMADEKLFAELSKRTTEYLDEQKKKFANPSMHLEQGDVNEPNVDLDTHPTGPQTDEDKLDDYFKNEVPAHDKRKSQVV